MLDNPLTAVFQFTDKRDVYCLLTIYRTGTNILNRRRKRGRGGCESLECPEIINDCNRFMGGVDTADQYYVYYAVGCKGLKWWRRVFYHLLEMAIINAYVCDLQS